MAAHERREALLEKLRGARTPLSGSRLGAEFDVSRQVIVGDIAWLRAAGHEIVSTARGYALMGAPGQLAASTGTREASGESQRGSAASQSDVSHSYGSASRSAGTSSPFVQTDVSHANSSDSRATAAGVRPSGGTGTGSRPRRYPCARTIKAYHSVEQTSDELFTILENGGEIVDVSVSHRVYGRLTAHLGISTREDALAFLNGIASGASEPLLTVTSGYHYHTIAAPSEAQLDRIERALDAKGYLAPLLPYERS